MADQNIFVDPDNGSDSNDGTGTSDAYKTVQNALGDVTATGADTAYIELMAGSYNPTTQGAGWYPRFFSSTDDDKNYYIRSTDAGTQRVFTFDTTNAQRALRLDAEGMHLTIKDVDFGDCAKNNLLTMGGLDTEGTGFTFDNVNCDSVNSTIMISLAAQGSGVSCGEVKILNSTLTTTTADGNIIVCRVMDNGIRIYNSTLLSTHDGDGLVIDMNSKEVAFLNVIDSTLSGGRCVQQASQLILDYMLQGSSFKTIRTGSAPQKLFLTGEEYNTFDDWADSTAYAKGDKKEWEGWVYECVHAHTSVAATNRPSTGTDWEAEWKLWEKITFTAINCHFEHVGATGLSHVLGLFFGTNAYLDGCTVLGGDVQISGKCNRITIKNTYAYGPNTCTVYSRGGGSVSNCYFESTGDTTCLGISRQNTAGSIHYPHRRAHNNILIAYSGSRGAITCDSSTGDYYCDKNIYNNGGGGVLAELNSVNKTTLSAIQSFYETNSQYTKNDQNSKTQLTTTKRGMYLDMTGDGVKEWVGIPQGLSSATRYNSGGRY